VAVSVKNTRNGFRHEYWNRRAAELFEVAPEKVLGLTDREWLPPEEAKAREEKEAAALQGHGVAESVEETTALAGGPRQLRTLRVPIRDTQGAPLYLLTIAEDVTEQRRAEEARQRLESQLRQAQKIEAIGRLAGGIAHDFNNILAAIIPAAQMAREDAAHQPEVRENLDEVLTAAERARKLVQQILAFSRQSKQERRVVALGPVVREALRMLRAVLPASLEIVEHIEDSAPPVLADATQIHQIVVNLCTNAEHAMRGRAGRLEVSLLRYDAGPEDTQRRPGMRQGLHARITVRDNGHGMEPDTLKRIFDPFFTTKAPGEGTGLGLAVVHGIVQEHEGVIEVYSQLAKGTSFHIFLPACAAVPEAVAEPPDASPRGQGERILFVDDERAVCELAKRTLEKRGYRVVWHTNPQEAVAQFTVSPRQFDLVLTDLTMPGMTGVDLALHVLAVRPEIPVVLATGFGGAWTPENARRLGIREVLLKPIGQDELALTLHRLLHPNGRKPAEPQA
jgi:PAS domain S-box-containing protein